MKTITFTLASLLLLSFSLFADETKKEDVKEKPIELNAQTHCPVMGGVIDSTVFTDIQGQRVYHCCAGCSKPLKNDPDKFFKKAAAEGILFENIQTTCPMTGEDLENKSVFSDFEGRRVYFCCKKCQEKFAEKPQEILSSMDKPVVEEKKEQAKGHEGHNH